MVRTMDCRQKVLLAVKKNCSVRGSKCHTTYQKGRISVPDLRLCLSVVLYSRADHSLLPQFKMIESTRKISRSAKQIVIEIPKKGRTQMSYSRARHYHSHNHSHYHSATFYELHFRIRSIGLTRNEEEIDHGQEIEAPE